LILTIADPGDSILLPDPTYANYYGQIDFALKEARQVLLPIFESNSWSYAPDKKQIVEHMQELYERHHPKIMLFTSPDNPTGQIVPHEVIRSALEMAEDGGTYVVIDFAYKALYFKDVPDYFSWSPVDYPNLVTIHSTSKWARGLGRRLGWIEAAENVIQGLERTQQCTILCPDSLHQMALTAYLKESTKDGTLKQYISNTRDDYKRAAELTVKAIERNLPYRFLRPEGGLYTVLDVEMDGEIFVRELLRHTGVVLIPGAGFGPSLKNGVRISYGPLVRDPGKIEEGIERVGRFVRTTKDIKR
jgi:aminotransferase